MEKDIAVLRVSGIDAKPVEYATETLPGIEVYIRGYTATNLENFPYGEQIESKLYSSLQTFKWPATLYKGNNKWNKKSAVQVDVYGLEGKFSPGFSGSPVFYPKNNKVVGMFIAKDDNYGYVIPIETILQRFYDITPSIPKEVSLFISKPSSKNLSLNQEKILNKLKEVIVKNDITIKFLEPEQYSRLPLDRIRKVLEHCHGVITLGFKQFYINDGVLKKGASREEKIKNYFLATPWNDIEGAMAFMLNLPILTISEKGINDGIFDKEVAKESFIHRITLDSVNWWESKEFIHHINEWFGDVLDYYKKMK